MKINILFSVFLTLFEYSKCFDFSSYDQNSKYSILQKQSFANYQIPKKVVCYYSSWSRNRPNAAFNPEDIDPNLCTHINYAFAKIRYGQLIPMEIYLEETYGYNIGLYQRVINLKRHNPKLKVLLSIGSHDLTGELKRIISNKSKRHHFIRSAIDLITKYGFDGIDLNFDEKKNY
ncbi:unnamed protein product [Brachionus calyciflorus]|uniref:GH18 domain-containing protein n=1 Tax=Brachionus calyciflorus TaxID=104777 RepID=A0A814J637_9BILA|nr:unnamed protein product [Brachionus calyciflorus]